MTRLTTASLLAALLALPSAVLADDAAAPEVPAAGETSDTDVAEPLISADAELPAPATPPVAPDRVAYAGPPGQAEVAVPPAVPPPSPTGLQRYRDTDAASGRAFITGTGVTLRKGSAAVQMWAPVIPIIGLVSVDYGVTDRLQIGATTGFVVVEDSASAGAVGAKFALIKRPRAALAVSAQVMFGEDSDEELGLVSAIGSACLDRACNTLGTLHLSAIPEEDTSYQDAASRTALHVVAGGSLVTGKKLKLVIDAAIAGDDYDSGMVFYGGLRYASPKLSVDVGFAGANVDDNFEIAPLPLIAASARW